MMKLQAPASEVYQNEIRFRFLIALKLQLRIKLIFDEDHALRGDLHILR